MAYKKRFNTSSAYGQLILLVFLPICVLAAVGGILVFHETMRASDSEQEALAEAVLIRYTPVIAELIPDLLEQERQQAKSNTDEASQSAMTTLESIQDKLGRMQSEQHVQRIAIINEGNQVLATVGYGLNEKWPLISDSAKFLSQKPTPVGTAYGSVLGEFEGQTLWLLVDMDNEPLYIARYRIAMALVITGLFTILILLLSLNIYSKRWIAPIYELRLQLQRTHVDNLYQPVPVESDGELNLLQKIWSRHSVASIEVFKSLRIMPSKPKTICVWHLMRWKCKTSLFEMRVMLPSRPAKPNPHFWPTSATSYAHH